MGGVNVSPCRCCMFVSCVHPVTVLNAAFCMTCSLLMLVDDAKGILQSQSYDCIIGSHGVSFCLKHPVAVAFMICRGLCACTEIL